MKSRIGATEGHNLLPHLHFLSLMTSHLHLQAVQCHTGCQCSGSPGRVLVPHVNVTDFDLHVLQEIRNQFLCERVRLVFLGFFALLRLFCIKSRVLYLKVQPCATLLGNHDILEYDTYKVYATALVLCNSLSFFFFFLADSSNFSIFFSFSLLILFWSLSAS